MFPSIKETFIDLWLWPGQTVNVDIWMAKEESVEDASCLILCCYGAGDAAPLPIAGSRNVGASRPMAVRGTPTSFKVPPLSPFLFFLI